MDSRDDWNQPPALQDHDLFSADLPLAEAFAAEDLAPHRAGLEALGRRLGHPEIQDLGRLANEHPPRLRTHDRFGHRIDEVEFHPAWHAMLQLGVEHGVHNRPWVEPRAGAHVARLTALYLLSQVEAGVTCPLSMTFAAVPTLRHAPEVAAPWLSRLRSREYDPRFVPAPDKRGVLLGMAMTERQGGSDVRANRTTARPLDGGAGLYELHGHKWFCSAPMCDAFLTLARTEAGLTCFLVPRFDDAGRHNPFRIQRLKDKLGNRSNASGEIEFDATRAARIGPDGRGIPTIIEMVHHTRLDCIAGSAAQMRQALFQAAHHAAHRDAFGQRLARQPLMIQVLADLAIEVEAATLAMVRVARSFDDGAGAAERAFGRLATPVMKYWICKRGPAVVGEALECVGGNGYVEESILPRLYREAPLMSIWEGSGNVMCLDVLRALSREPECAEAFLAELQTERGRDPRFDRHVTAVETALRGPQDPAGARRLSQQLALALQGALLLRHGHPAATEGFLASRLGDRWLGAFGSLPRDLDGSALLERHTPR